MSIKNNFDLAGKTAFITGSSQGIGKAIALGLADFGANVIIHYHHNLDKARTTQLEIEKKGAKAYVVKRDLGEPDAPSSLYEEISELKLSVDILVLNVSVQQRKPWQEINAQEFDRQMTVNFKSSFQLAQLFAPAMIKNQWGRILTIGSIQQSKPHPDMLIYSASKVALVNMVKSLAWQLAPNGVTVNNIAPGVFETIRNEKALADQDYRNLVLSKVPAGKFGDLEDCAGIAVTLCSQAGKYITGQDIYVDGGMSL